MEKNEECSMSALHMSEKEARNHVLNTDLIMMQMTKSRDKSSIGQQSHPQKLHRKTGTLYVL